MDGFARRGFVSALGGLAGLLAVPSLARTQRPTGRSPVIDGNLAVPFDPDAPVDAATAREVRASGLTAAKLTLGGSGNRSRAETTANIDETDRAIAQNPTLFLKVRSATDFAEAQRSRRVGVIYSFEAGEMHEGRIDSIDAFRARDVLVMGLSYNLDTPFASGVMSRTGQGLTPLGRQAIDRMNAKGVTVDVSHSDEASSLAAITASRTPILITHAGCAAVHSHPRNKSDHLLRALASGGGVCGIFDLSYIVPYPRQPRLNDYLAHLVHALTVCGEDHVGIGSDTVLTHFDTSAENMTAWRAETERRQRTGVAAPGEGPPPFVIGLNRSDRCAIIGDALRRRGYRAAAVDKVLGGNFARVFAETWRQA